ncbi:histidinol-phosphate aminotransferase [Trueperella bonasi]|uniref:Histidinol-phosphate aminotransferase n=1 Tax=Trueperella bonasi TaxID=312286 RepID=A0ABT9NGL9_9ACTO|nr:histidinol-phosphate transaminase [Trueperella bonasi]MDP9806489.1 histidinol-phosphate aminotransferase [Trueperella bonasi]
MTYFRPELSQLPAYIAGRASTDPEIIKVSSNEMPFPTLPGVEAVIAARIGDLNRYPDMGNGVLREAIAAYHKTSVANVAVGNGSTALIEKFLTAICTPASEVVMPWRSFEAYPIAIQVAGGTPVGVPLRADGKPDLAAMLDAVTPKTRAILVCTPNNPTGAALTHDELHRFMRAVPREIPVLIDEAYEDFVTMNDPVRGLELVRQFPNAVSLRTFSKAYGLAGIRVGYALGVEDIVLGLDKVATPFGVNMLAQAAAVAALQVRPAVDQRVAAIVAEREKLMTALRALEWNGPDSQANFVWFELGEGSERFARHCAEEKIVVRTFADEGVRVSVAEREASLRLLRAYKKFRGYAG